MDGAHNFTGHQRPSSRRNDLTPREAQVFDLVCIGRSNRQVADQLGISLRTVEVFRSRLMLKVNADTFAELMWIGLFGYKPVDGWSA